MIKKAKCLGLQICKQCGEEFEKIESKQKFCSDKCSEIFKQEKYRREHPLKSFEDRTCESCGVVFTPKYADQIYCTTECRDNFYKYTPVCKTKTKNCKICGKEFIIRGSNHTYCSTECANQSDTITYTRRQYIIFERDNFQCFYCGRTPYQDNVVLHADHIFPKSLGGKNTANNLVTSCSECNVSKSNNLLHNPDPILEEVAKRNKEQGINDYLIIKF